LGYRVSQSHIKSGEMVQYTKAFTPEMSIDNIIQRVIMKTDTLDRSYLAQKQLVSDSIEIEEYSNETT